VATPDTPPPRGETALCRLAEIAEGQARGFSFGTGARRLEVLVARRAGQVFAYENRCPHAGTPLDWQPDRFMSADGRHLQCATHGALFQVEDGLCVSAPCPGKRLKSLPARVAPDGQVMVDLSESLDTH
jgi:nitrite reductase/ring-hydroxylating ferredoxin subunit